MQIRHWSFRLNSKLCIKSLKWKKTAKSCKCLLRSTSNTVIPCTISDIITYNSAVSVLLLPLPPATHTINSFLDPPLCREWLQKKCWVLHWKLRAAFIFVADNVKLQSCRKLHRPFQLSPVLVRVFVSESSAMIFFSLGSWWSLELDSEPKLRPMMV